jgi:hypothetical protein
MASERDMRAFRVGDTVVVHVGRNDLLAQVIEDRGNLGPGGGRIFRVAVSFSEGAESSEFEVPASALDATPAAV